MNGSNADTATLNSDIGSIADRGVKKAIVDADRDARPIDTLRNPLGLRPFAAVDVAGKAKEAVMDHVIAHNNILGRGDHDSSWITHANNPEYFRAQNVQRLANAVNTPLPLTEGKSK